MDTSTNGHEHTLIQTEFMISIAFWEHRLRVLVELIASAQKSSSSFSISVYSCAFVVALDRVEHLFQEHAVGAGIRGGFFCRGAHLHTLDHDGAIETSDFELSKNGFKIHFAGAEL